MNIKRFISGIVSMSLLTTMFSTMLMSGTIYAESPLYLQDFNIDDGQTPSGWLIPEEVKNVQYDVYDFSAHEVPEAVNGGALHAYSNGPGDRPAYVNIDMDSLVDSENKNYLVYDFDLYLENAVNTCNLFTLGNNQDDSYTNLNNTFFALGNGDGVGARNTLRFYDYNHNEWVSIPDMGSKWIHIKIYADSVNKKMAFTIQDASGNNIRTYGPFSVESKFDNSEMILNKIVMSGFRSNGGYVTLNTWVDNFCISSMDDQEKMITQYSGIMPEGTVGEDYSFEESNDEIILVMKERSSLRTLTPVNDDIISFKADFMIPELPEEGYVSIISYNDDVNGNVLVNEDGRLLAQKSIEVYNAIGDDTYKVKPGNWYHIEAFIKISDSSDKAYNTFEVTGIFDGKENAETVEYTASTRNADNFNTMDLSIGGNIENTNSLLVKFKDSMEVELVDKKNVTILYDETKGNVNINEVPISSGASVYNKMGSFLNIIPNDEYEIEDILVNGESSKKYTYISPVYGFGCYVIPVSSQETTIQIVFNEKTDPIITHTINEAPYALDPAKDWEERKLASKAGTLKIDDSIMVYRLFEPVNYNNESDEKYPLVVFLRGDIYGTDNISQLDDVSMAKALTDEINAYEFPCFILAPQSRYSNWDANDGINKVLLSEIVEMTINSNPNIDTNRIYICGNSGGANVVLDIVAENPDRYAAAVTISGIIKDNIEIDTIENIPVWTFYALDDAYQEVPVSNASFVQKMRNAGGKIYETIYDIGSHNIWYNTYNSPVIRWLFSINKNSTNEDSHMNNVILDYNNSLKKDLSSELNLEKSINNDNWQTEETELGDLATDAIRRYTDADIAVITGSDISAGISEGSLTEEKIINAFPTKTNISVVELTGEDIMDLMTVSVGYYPENNDRFLQVSGINIEVNASLRPSQRIVSLLVNGEPIQTDKIYKVAITTRLLLNNLYGTYSGNLNPIEEYYQTLPQMFLSYLEEEYTELEVVGNRINIID